VHHSYDLNESHRLNPWLADPNHLEPDKMLHLPSAQDFADTVAAKTLASYSQEGMSK
jgi:hypothetical protein